MIAIVDYGVGNLRSVYKAFESVATPLQIPVDIVDAPTDLTRWRAVVLPGQGAFGDSVDNFRRLGFEAPLLEAVQAGLPLLGICVGMQLLFDGSEEMGQHEGLHIIPGFVRRFPAGMADPGASGHTLRVPQIGWNQLHRCADDPLLEGVPDGAYAYFAHSYFCDVADPQAVLAATDYGLDYPSIVRYKNAWGIQPHPEKSHTVGLRILSNFMRMVASSSERSPAHELLALALAEMAQTLLYLIRHAHTQADPALDSAHWRLSPVGEQQSLLLATQPFWGQVQLVAVSSELKTRLTVAPVLAQRSLPVVVERRFDELHRPGWIDDYNAQVAQAFAQPDQPAGSWEPASAALARFLAGVHDLCAQYAGQTLALVGHGLVLSLYRAALLGYPQVHFDEWRQLGFAAVALADPITSTLLVDFRAVAGEAPRRG